MLLPRCIHRETHLWAVADSPQGRRRSQWSLAARPVMCAAAASCAASVPPAQPSRSRAARACQSAPPQSAPAAVSLRVLKAKACGGCMGVRVSRGAAVASGLVPGPRAGTVAGPRATPGGAGTRPVYQLAVHALQLSLTLERHDTTQAAVVTSAREFTTYEDGRDAGSAGHLAQFGAQRVAVFAHLVELERRVLGPRAVRARAGLRLRDGLWVKVVARVMVRGSGSGSCATCRAAA